MKSCRKALEPLTEGGTNASLLMAHYLKETKETKGAADNSQTAISARADLFNAMREAVQKVEKSRLYEAAFNRRKAILDPIATASSFQTKGVMVIGLGGSNVLETGLTLNPLYGTPMIPGSSIKGIVAHYCSTVLGKADPRYKGPDVGSDNKPRQKAGDIYEALFGKLEQSKDEATSMLSEAGAESGFLRFYDAWMVPDSVAKSLVPDVMTPHHGAYYTGNLQEPPTDFDDPNPVTFMTVKGTFEVRIGCEEPDEEKRKAWLKFAHDIAKDALTALGVGGKTRAGYGRMELYLSPEEKAEQQKAKKEEEQRRAAEDEQRANRDAGFMHIPEEIVTLTCFKVDKKHGKSKFRIDDEKPIQWSVKTPFKEVGETVQAKIVRIGPVDRSQKGYVVTLIE